MLTARTEDMDQVLGLEMGADDYVAKPFTTCFISSYSCFITPYRQTVEDEVAQRIEFDDLVIDNGGRSVTLNGELVDFTSAEYDLLWLLASNAGRIFPVKIFLSVYVVLNTMVRTVQLIVRISVSVQKLVMIQKIQNVSRPCVARVICRQRNQWICNSFIIETWVGRTMFA